MEFYGVFIISIYYKFSRHNLLENYAKKSYNVAFCIAAYIENMCAAMYECASIYIMDALLQCDWKMHCVLQSNVFTRAPQSPPLLSPGFISLNFPFIQHVPAYWFPVVLQIQYSSNISWGGDDLGYRLLGPNSRVSDFVNLR